MHKGQKEVAEDEDDDMIVKGDSEVPGEGAIRKQFEQKKQLLELKKKELESRKAEIIKRLESSGSTIVEGEANKGAGVNEGGGGEAESKMTRRKSSKDLKDDKDKEEGQDVAPEGGESRLRRWKLRHQKIQEELKNITSISSPARRSKSQRAKAVTKSDEDDADEIEEKKYNSHDGTTSENLRKRSSDSDDSDDDSENRHVMYVIEKFYGKSKSAREGTKRSKSKGDLRGKKQQEVSVWQSSLPFLLQPLT